MTTPYPPSYFPQVKPQVLKNRNVVRLRSQLMVRGKAKLLENWFCCYTFLGDTLFHPFRVQGQVLLDQKYYFPQV